jgi:hypothetical protein
MIFLLFSGSPTDASGVGAPASKIAPDRQKNAGLALPNPRASV